MDKKILHLFYTLDAYYCVLYARIRLLIQFDSIRYLANSTWFDLQFLDSCPSLFNTVKTAKLAGHYPPVHGSSLLISVDGPPCKLPTGHWSLPAKLAGHVPPVHGSSPLISVDGPPCKLPTGHWSLPAKLAGHVPPVHGSSPLISVDGPPCKLPTGPQSTRPSRPTLCVPLWKCETCKIQNGERSRKGVHFGSFCK